MPKEVRQKHSYLLGFAEIPSNGTYIMSQPDLNHLIASEKNYEKGTSKNQSKPEHEIRMKKELSNTD
jgi:hypothetical protein